MDDYARKLMAMPVEAQGFINWAIAGLAVFLGQGNLYKPPASVLLHRDIWAGQRQSCGRVFGDAHSGGRRRVRLPC